MAEMKTCAECGRRGTKQFTRQYSRDGVMTIICRGRAACTRRSFYQLTPEERAQVRSDGQDNP